MDRLNLAVSEEWNGEEWRMEVLEREMEAGDVESAR